MSGRIWEYHLFTADNASMVTHCGHLLLSSIRITLIHIPGSRAISHEVPQTGDERPGSHVYVANHVQRDAVECNDNRKEAKIRGQLEKIFGTS